MSIGLSIATCVFVFITIIVVGIAVGVTTAQAVSSVRTYVRYSLTCYGRYSTGTLYTYVC
jgi:hypothetical protein